MSALPTLAPAVGAAGGAAGGEARVPHASNPNIIYQLCSEFGPSLVSYVLYVMCGR